jgi:hypothetical protein
MSQYDFEKIQESFTRHINSHTEKLIDEVGHHVLAIEVSFETLIREREAAIKSRDYYKLCCEQDQEVRIELKKLWEAIPFLFYNGTEPRSLVVAKDMRVRRTQVTK